MHNLENERKVTPWKMIEKMCMYTLENVRKHTLEIIRKITIGKCTNRKMANKKITENAHPGKDRKCTT